MPGDSSLEDEVLELKTKLSKTEVENNELKTKLSKLEVENTSDTKIKVENTVEDTLTEAMKALMLSTVQFPSYKTGENFSRFCEKFQETFKSAKLTNSCVKTKIMQNVDDDTYEILKAITIPENMKYSLVDVCEIFETAMCNPVSSIPLTKSQLYDTKQKSGETVMEFVSRIREAVSVAGIPESERNEVKNVMLVKGTSNLRVKKKVAVNMERPFEEIVLLVKEVLAVDKIIFGENNTVTNPVPVMQVETKGNASSEEVEQRRGRSRSRNYSKGSSRSGSRDYQSRGRERYNNSRFGSSNRSRSRSRYHNNRSRSRSQSDNYRNRSNSRGRYNRYSDRRSVSRGRSDRYDRYRQRSNSRGRYNRSNSTSRDQEGCYLCGEKGHFCRNCPQRRKNLN